MIAVVYFIDYSCWKPSLPRSKSACCFIRSLQLLWWIRTHDGEYLALSISSDFWREISFISWWFQCIQESKSSFVSLTAYWEMISISNWIWCLTKWTIGEYKPQIIPVICMAVYCMIAARAVRKIIGLFCFYSLRMQSKTRHRHCTMIRMTSQ